MQRFVWVLLFCDMKILNAVDHVLRIRSQISLGSLTPYDTKTYGSDTTYYFATTPESQPTPAPQPDPRSVVKT